MTTDGDYILSFSSSEATLGRVGGKGANLAELTRAGFPVPPGFLITTDAYRAFVETHQLQAVILALANQASPDNPASPEHASEHIGALFARASMPDPIAREIASAYATVAQPAVAVRSSATAEDLPGLSFAGQQDTYLNVVGSQAVLDAVKECWASLWTARAIGYRARNGISHDDVALAVVVQAMIASEVSGIVFTANPVTGNGNEIVVDASYGLGEALVSGQVEPDHYVVDAIASQIIQRMIGAKALAILPRAEGGTQQIAQANENRHRQALPDARIVDLAHTAQRIAQHFGAPQDIEWALANGELHILQSRPITSLYPLPPRASLHAPLPGGEGSDLRVYFSFNSVQGVTDPFTSLGTDGLQMVFGGFLPLLHIKRNRRDVLLSAGDRLFIDVTDMVRDPRLRKLYLAGMSAVDPGARQIISRLAAQGRLPIKRSLTPRVAIRTARALLPKFAGAIPVIYAPEHVAEGAFDGAEQLIAQVQRHAQGASNLKTLLEAMEYDLSRSLQVIVTGFVRVIPVLLTLRLIDLMLQRWLDEKPGASLKLTRGLPNNVTTQMDLRLWQVAQTIRGDPASFQVMTTQAVESLVGDLRAGNLPAVAQCEITAFLDAYGFRGAVEIDIGRPRWRDDPTPIVQALRGYLQLQDPDAAPDAIFRRNAEEAECVAREYVMRTRKLRFGRMHAKFLGGLIRRLRLLAGLRESPKFYLVKVLGMYRDALLSSGRDLVAQGTLVREDDIFFVPFDTLHAYANGEATELKAIVAAERAAYQFEQRRRLMPRILLSTGEAFYEGMTDSGARAGDLVGQAVSPGLAEGIVRVMFEPREAQLAPGEILVCRATDPSWTPLFMTAGGLVMEIGGMMTHGSVVAREYGVPAVVGVNEAMIRLKTGQRVRVDGSRGRVTILPEIPDPSGTSAS